MKEINIEATEVTMPLITDDELNTIDNNLHSIIDDFLKYKIRDKELYLAQYIMKKLEKENQELKKQLEYLRSEEYLNQLKFERNMLEDIVQNEEISKEDKEFIDMTHRNTELLAQQKEFIKYLEDEINPYKELADNKSLSFANGLERYETFQHILSKYKEIIESEQN